MKKRLIAFLASITLIAQLGFVMPLTAGAAGNAYYVSVNGSDENPGTKDDPFKTISKATKVMKAGDTCYIMGGIYREAANMNIYGTATNPVTYQAYNNEEVIVTTADLLTWDSQPADGNGDITIWRAPMDWTVKSGRGNMVFEGNKMQREASWPNISDFLVEENWAHIGIGELNMDYKTATITHEAIPDVNLTGAIVSYDTGGGYWNYTSKITSNEDNQIVFTTQDHTTNVIPAVGKKFYITRDYDLIDEAGEWYKDESEGCIFYATSSDAATPPSTVAAKKRTNTLLMDNAQYVVVKGITLQGGAPLTGDLTKNCTWDGITVVNADYEIYGDRTTRPAATGFVVNGSYNTLKNSEIKESYGHGVSVQGHDNRIINNEIHDINYQHNYSDAVSVNGTRNLVSYNTMYRLGRGAIGGGPRNCEISYNDIYDTMRISDDGGAIYLLGDLNNTRIHHNLIHDSINDTNTKRVGIYYDNGATKLITYNNVVYNLEEPLFVNTPSVNNVFFNNTFMNDIKVASENSGSSKSTMQGTVFINNVFKTTPLTNDIITNQAPVYDNNVVASSVSVDANGKPVADTSLAAGKPISGITAGAYVGAYDEGTNWVAGKQATAPEIYFEEDTMIPFKNIAVNYGFENDFEGYTIETGTPEILTHSAWTFNKEFTFTGDKALALDTNDAVSYKATGLKPNTEYEIEFFSKIRGLLLKPYEYTIKSEGSNFSHASGLRNITDGSYIGYKDVDFGDGRFNAATFQLMAPQSTTKIEVRLDAPDGQVIASYQGVNTSTAFFDRYWMPYFATVTGMASVKGVHDVYVVFVTRGPQQLNYGGLELHHSNTAADVIEATAISDGGQSAKYEAKYKSEPNIYRPNQIVPTWGQKPEKFTVTTGGLGEIDVYLKKAAGSNIGYIDLVAIRDTSLNSVKDVVVGNAKIVDGNFDEVLSLGNSTVNIVEFDVKNNLNTAGDYTFAAVARTANDEDKAKSEIKVSLDAFESRKVGVGVNLQNIPGGYILLKTMKGNTLVDESVLANIFAVNQREETSGIAFDKVWLTNSIQKVSVGNKTFNAIIKNNSEESKTIDCIVAFYGANGGLISVDRVTDTLNVNEIKTFSKEMTVPANCTYAKMFAWESGKPISVDIALGL